MIPAGTLDEDPGIRPLQNIHWQDRADWYEAVDGVPQTWPWPPRQYRSELKTVNLAHYDVDRGEAQFEAAATEEEQAA